MQEQRGVSAGTVTAARSVFTGGDLTHALSRRIPRVGTEPPRRPALQTRAGHAAGSGDALWPLIRSPAPIGFGPWQVRRHAGAAPSRPGGARHDLVRHEEDVPSREGFPPRDTAFSNSHSVRARCTRMRARRCFYSRPDQLVLSPDEPLDREQLWWFLIYARPIQCILMLDCHRTQVNTNHVGITDVTGRFEESVHNPG